MEGTIWKRLKGDKVIWILVILLAMYSILAVFSASSYMANKDGVDKTVYLLEQGRSVLIGFVILLLCNIFPVKGYKYLSFIYYAATLVLAIMMFTSSDELHGASRTLKIGAISFQPIELIKIGIVMYLARALDYWNGTLSQFKDFALKIILPLSITVVLVLSNGFSSAVLLASVSILMLLVMNVDLKNLALMIIIWISAFFIMYGIYLVFIKDNPKVEQSDSQIIKVFKRFSTIDGRVEDFIEEMKSSKQENTEELTELEKDEIRQSEYAKNAISEGKLFGKGPGKSTARFDFAMAYSDFIYAFIIEEYGLLLGGLPILAIYLVFFFRCIRLSGRCTAIYSGALVSGLSIMITLQAMLHIMVNVRLLPVTGQTLPLVSHGGTAYVALSAAFGMILSVSRQLDWQDAKDKSAENKWKEAKQLSE